MATSTQGPYQSSGLDLGGILGAVLGTTTDKETKNTQTASGSSQTDATSSSQQQQNQQQSNVSSGTTANQSTGGMTQGTTNDTVQAVTGGNTQQQTGSNTSAAVGGMSQSQVGSNTQNTTGSNTQQQTGGSNQYTSSGMNQQQTGGGTTTGTTQNAQDSRTTGTVTSTTGGTRNFGSSVQNTADTSQLQQVFQQQMAGVTPEMLAAIFNEGSRQAPGIVNAMSSALGARAGGSTPVAAALNMLNSQLVDKAALMKMQLLQQAGLTAQQIAALTSGQTTSGSEATSQTQTQVQDLLTSILGTQTQNQQSSNFQNTAGTSTQNQVGTNFNNVTGTNTQQQVGTTVSDVTGTNFQNTTGTNTANTTGTNFQNTTGQQTQNVVGTNFQNQTGQQTATGVTNTTGTTTNNAQSSTAASQQQTATGTENVKSSTNNTINNGLINQAGKMLLAGSSISDLYNWFKGSNSFTGSLQDFLSGFGAQLSTDPQYKDFWDSALEKAGLGGSNGFNLMPPSGNGQIQLPGSDPVDTFLTNLLGGNTPPPQLLTGGEPLPPTTTDYDPNQYEIDPLTGQLVPRFADGGFVQAVAPISAINWLAKSGSDGSKDSGVNSALLAALLKGAGASSALLGSQGNYGSGGSSDSISMPSMGGGGGSSSSGGGSSKGGSTSPSSGGQSIDNGIKDGVGAFTGDPSAGSWAGTAGATGQGPNGNSTLVGTMPVANNQLISGATGILASLAGVNPLLGLLLKNIAPGVVNQMFGDKIWRLNDTPSSVQRDINEMQDFASKNNEPLSKQLEDQKISDEIKMPEMDTSEIDKALADLNNEIDWSGWADQQLDSGTGGNIDVGGEWDPEDGDWTFGQDAGGTVDYGGGDYTPEDGDWTFGFADGGLIGAKGDAYKNYILSAFGISTQADGSMSMSPKAAKRIGHLLTRGSKHREPDSNEPDGDDDDAVGIKPKTFANGGLIKGPGTGISDSIPAVTNSGQPIKVANNEYIIPADVVKNLGVNFFDALVDKYHVPAEMQRAVGIQ